MKRAWPSIFRGTLLGFPIGLLPGPSGTLSSFAAYKLEKYACRKNPEFGHGAMPSKALPVPRQPTTPPPPHRSFRCSRWVCPLRRL